VNEFKRTHEAIAGSVLNRDMELSAFGQILLTLVRGLPGALAAVLVDDEGETVDYAGTLSAYDLRVVGAEGQLLMRFKSAGSKVRQISTYAGSRMFLVRALFEGYVLVVVARTSATPSFPSLSLDAADYDLCAEAGYSSRATWRSIPVESNKDGQPTGLYGQSVTVESSHRMPSQSTVLFRVRDIGCALHEIVTELDVKGISKRWYTRVL
jgi:hypothetical protein